MLESIINNYNVLKSMILDQELRTDSNNNALSKDEIKTNKESAALIEKSLPTETELAELKFFVKLIAPLKDLTNDLSGSKYPTASMVYPSIFSLLHYEIDNRFLILKKS